MQVPKRVIATMLDIFESYNKGSSFNFVKTTFITDLRFGFPISLFIYSEKLKNIIKISALQFVSNIIILINIHTYSHMYIHIHKTLPLQSQKEFRIQNVLINKSTIGKYSF